MMYSIRRDRDGKVIATVIEARPATNGQPAVRRSPLRPRFELCNHSPDGFEYGTGTGGSGPAQLALAILAHHLPAAGEAEAVRLHQAFKRAVVAAVPPHSCAWGITSAGVDRVLSALRLGEPPPTDAWDVDDGEGD